MRYGCADGQGRSIKGRGLIALGMRKSGFPVEANALIGFFMTN
jgi:hypothetical protein